MGRLRLTPPTTNLAETISEFFDTPSSLPVTPTSAMIATMLGSPPFEVNLTEFAPSSTTSHDWVLDSGTNTHLTGETSSLSALDIKGEGAVTFDNNNFSDVL